MTTNIPRLNQAVRILTNHTGWRGSIGFADVITDTTVIVRLSTGAHERIESFSLDEVQPMRFDRAEGRFVPEVAA